VTADLFRPLPKVELLEVMQRPEHLKRIARELLEDAAFAPPEVKEALLARLSA
jgi:hypothetical protein